MINNNFSIASADQYTSESETIKINSFNESYEDFLIRFPEYLNTSSFDKLREKEFARLDVSKHVYLDYTGACLYGKSLIEEYANQLKGEILGNPHSNNTASIRSSELIEETRQQILEYFHADPDKYCVVFTQNATHAIKIVAESFPFESDSRLLMTVDNHNSVLGIREYALQGGTKIDYLEIDDEYRLMESDFREKIKHVGAGLNLLCFAAQSNYSGVKHNLHLINEAHKNGWLTLIDMAAYAPTNRVDINQYQPDFAAISFYKMFGFPTGIGCLLAKRKSLKLLKKVYFSGGTVLGSSVMLSKKRMADYEAAYEDGTLNFGLIPAVVNGLKFIQAFGIENLTQRTNLLCSWLLDRMQGFKHSNGLPVIEIYGPRNNISRGPTVAFNIRSPNGEWWDPKVIEAEASLNGISVRAGYHCNPGVNEKAMKLSVDDIQNIFAHEKISDFLWAQEQSIRGAVRVSMGMATNFKDIYVFHCFLKSYIDRPSNHNL